MNQQLTGKTREIIRLWNSMRACERELQRSPQPERATAKVLDIRRELQRALAERDSLIEASRSSAA